jgi:hypothetical protein
MRAWRPCSRCRRRPSIGTCAPGGTIVEVDGVLQPAPAPRFSRTPSDPPSAPARPGEHSRQALVDWGFDAAEVERLHEAGAVVSAPEAVASEVVK